MVILSPVGLATTALVADQVSLLATYKENLSKAFSTHGGALPQITISYSTEAPILNQSTTFVPVVATISVVTPGCKTATTQIFTERYFVAFQGQTTLPTSVTITSVGRQSLALNASCCKAKSIAVYDSLVVTIA